MIFKIQHNIRINNDFNVSVSGEFVVDSEDEAREAGTQMQEYVDAYMEGYIQKSKDDED